MPAKFRPCTDLSNDIRKQTPNHQSGLCAVCEKINFVSLTSKAYAADGHRSHFHIGTLQQVMRKTFCSGCRLILSAARTMDHSDNMFEESNITIRIECLPAWLAYPVLAFPETEYTGDDGVRNGVATPHMESSIDVIFDGSDGEYETPAQFTVAGTIIRMEEAEPADSAGVKSTIVESEEADFRGRKVLSVVNIDLIKQWMQSCSLQHDSCRLPALETSREQNFRLIDVQENRIISATLAEEYVALSYVWGPDTKPSLTQDTLSQCLSPNGLGDLTIPRTILDAMQLVKYIGKRYLWVDSLCIVQDDDNDKKQQLTIMDSIYTNAELIVVAAAGGDANAGLPGIGSTPRRISQRIERIEGTEFVTAQASVQQVLERSVWNTRGWTFQEVILSRRVLIFTESLVYWNCQVCAWREDMRIESSIAGLDLNETNSLWPNTFKDRAACRTRIYCHLAEAFSRKRLKEERDVVWAFVGILRLQATRFSKRFIWGLPYERLDATLLWSDVLRCNNVHSRHACHSAAWKSSFYDIPYPSWSWFSTDARISFMDLCGNSVISEVTWHEPLKFGDKTSTTYLESISLKSVADSLENKKNTSLLVRSTSDLDIMDYGLLHFTAQTAVLTLKRAAESSDGSGVSKARTLGGDTDRKESSTDRWVQATIHSSKGKRIGMLFVPFLFFDKESERSGEFVLLSSNAEEESDESCSSVTGGLDGGAIRHVDGCRHIQSRNIMLIESDGNIAYRRALGKVEKEDWKDVETEIKTIVLG